MNESVFYNVDEVYTAINETKKIRFKYYKRDINKKLIARKGGDWFELSPWGLTWADENYYMIAYDEWDGNVKTYRVDKMMRISILDEKRECQKEFNGYPTGYSITWKNPDIQTKDGSVANGKGHYTKMKDGKK